MCPTEPAPAAAPAVTEPATLHARETTYDGKEWRWRDDRRHRLELSPDIPAIVRDKIAEHGAPAIVVALGLSRVTVLGIGAGGAALASTMVVAGMRLPSLARLDAIADEHEAEAKTTKNGNTRRS